MKKESCNVTVAFFSVTANGTISVRKSNDYVAQMIALSVEPMCGTTGGRRRKCTFHNEHTDGGFLCRCKECRYLNI